METISASRTKFPGAVTFRIKAAPAARNVGRNRKSLCFLRKKTRAQNENAKRIIVSKAVTKLAPPQQTARGRERKTYKKECFFARKP